MSERKPIKPYSGRDYQPYNPKDIEKLEAEYTKFQKSAKDQIEKLVDDYGELEKKLEIAFEELRSVAAWKDAYPESVFPPIGNDTYTMFCKASGISVDRVSAHVLRKMVKTYSESAIKALRSIGEEDGK